tara:strand:+ start:4026 stop:5552 length:1527 start_codon:yes stop_codon:yes gene_type:complete
MKNFKILAFASLSLIFISCDDDYLETFPTEVLSQEQVSEAVAINPDAAKGTLIGIYEQLYRQGGGGTTSQEDFGVKSFDVFSDLLSTDLAHTGKSYNRMTSVSELTATLDPDSNYNYRPWRLFYRVINLSNLVIDGLGGDTADLTSETAAFTMGQARGLRAFAYFNLVHSYVNDISNLGKPVLPIYKSAADIEQPKSLLQDVFDFIIADLLAAESNLAGFQRTSKLEFNQDIARGLLAYTYGALNNWAKTAEYASLVMSNSAYPIMTAAEVAHLDDDDFVGGFNDVASHPGIIWGIDITAANALAALYSWWGHMDYFSYSYAAVGNRKAMDISIYNQIRSDDIRLKQFPYSSFGDGWLIPAGKFYASHAQDAGFAGFSGPNSNIPDDSHYMRVSEFYLLHAEASAELGQDAAARSSLKSLLDLRITDTSYVDALSGEALKDEISFQTRLELFAEGKSYFLMKRQRQTRTRGANWLDLAGESFNHDDERLTYELPQSELLFNNNFSDQN